MTLRKLLLLPILGLCFVSSGDARTTYQDIYAPSVAQFSKVIRLPSGNDTMEVSLSIFPGPKHRVSGETELSYFNSSKPTRLYEFQGKTVGKPGYRYVHPLSSLPVEEFNSRAVPSIFEARFHMRSPEGIVIRGVFNTSLSNTSPVVIDGESHARYRLFYRFKGTISDPSALGLQKKSFVMTRVEYKWVVPPDAD